MSKFIQTNVHKNTVHRDRPKTVTPQTNQYYVAKKACVMMWTCFSPSGYVQYT